MTFQQDATGQIEPITGNLTPLSIVTSPGSLELSAPLQIDAGIDGSSDVVLPLSISDVISTPTGVFRGQSIVVGEPLDTDFVQANLVETLVNEPPA